MDKRWKGIKNAQTVLLASEFIFVGWYCIEQEEYEKKISSSKLLNITADEDPVILWHVPFFNCGTFDSVVAEVNMRRCRILEKL